MPSNENEKSRKSRKSILMKLGDGSLMEDGFILSPACDVEPRAEEMQMDIDARNLMAGKPTGEEDRIWTCSAVGMAVQIRLDDSPIVRCGEC